MDGKGPIAAVVPGSFDPVTSGHLDIIERAAGSFQRVIVAVGANPSKNPMFTLSERCEILHEVCGPFPNVEVDILDGLLVEFARSHGALVIVKGLRAVSDFEYEFQQALMNSHMAPDIETFFLMARPEHLFLSSSLIKNVASLGGPITGLVPPTVERRLLDKIE
ncbi:MAG: pantetheine-phosphate adenylyltransferase [Armatimonadetes bacterium]|nr:pantetheine-phosphate adenylyltransferase [Armatimonadota bacterium]